MTTPAQRPIEWRDHGVGAGLGAAYVAWLLATARSLGFPRDEGFYFSASSQYARWFAAFFESPTRAAERSFVDGIWSANHEHPALMKSLFGLSWMYLHERWKVFADASTAFRLPTMIMAGVALWVTYLFGARAYSRKAGVIAAVSLALMPHVFFHAHLACFDAPIMTMWLLCIYVYWRSVKEGGLGWAVLAGVVYGLTLETKHNAWVLPAVIVPHALLVLAQASTAKDELRAGRIPVPASLLAMATIGPAVFVALWPWLWRDTIPRVQEYVNFHVHHEYYNIEFLHRNYFGPPSPKAYAPVMILASVPTVTLILFGIGAFDRGRSAMRRALALFQRAEAPPRDPAETDVLIALGLAAAVAPFFLPSTPIFGGTKHWMTAYPFLALLAGRGFDVVAGALARLELLAKADARRHALAQAALAASVLVGPLAITAHSHPFGLGAYVPLVGGTAGGADLGLYRTFWGYLTDRLSPYLEANAPPGATVYLHDTAWDSWVRMIDEKRVPPHLRGVGAPHDGELQTVHYELHMLETDYALWMTSGTTRPDYVLTHDGVPFVSVYRRGAGRPAAK